MRTTVLLCLLYLLYPSAWGDGRSAQQLSELDSCSHLLCASAMVYFNPQDRTPDPLNPMWYLAALLPTRLLDRLLVNKVALPRRA